MTAEKEKMISLEEHKTILIERLQERERIEQINIDCAIEGNNKLLVSRLKEKINIIGENAERMGNIGRSVACYEIEKIVDEVFDAKDNL